MTITYPPELLPEADDPETAEVIVDGTKLNHDEMDSLIRDIKRETTALQNLIKLMEMEIDGIKH